MTTIYERNQQKAGVFTMDSYTIQNIPAGFRLETGTDFYLISDKDMPLLKRGYTVPRRDQDKKSLGPAGMMYNCRNKTEVRLPTGEVLTLPMKVLQVADSIRRVLLSPASQECTA